MGLVVTCSSRVIYISAHFFTNVSLESCVIRLSVAKTKNCFNTKTWLKILTNPFGITWTAWCRHVQTGSVIHLEFDHFSMQAQLVACSKHLLLLCQFWIQCHIQL